ncbi:MAG: hypothetical protein LBT53_04150 [Puniceicoccales bacterium]|jgi:molybdopterin-binding protein|nr:hypothetical protein [Puniceicoccales bacterium]
MKLRARNILPEKNHYHQKRAEGPITALFTIAIAPRVAVSGCITSGVANERKLPKTAKAFPSVKVSSVMVGVE